MKKLLFLIAIIASMWQVAVAQEADTVWTKNLGTDVYRVEFVQNEEYILASTDFQLYKIRTSDAEIVNEFKLNSHPKNYAIMSDGERILLPGYNILDLKSGIIIENFYVSDSRLQYSNGDTTLPFKESGVGQIHLSPDDRYLAANWAGRVYFPNQTIKDYRKVVILDIIERKVIKIMDYDISKDPSAFAFSPDGKYLAVGFSNGDVELWDGKTFEFVKYISKIDNKISHLEFNFDASLIQICNGKLNVLETNTLNNIFQKIL